MADYGSKYTFRIDIEGQEAIDRGKVLRKKLAEVLEAQLQPTVELTRALEEHEAVLQSVNEAITSQTRRLSYNMKRNEEAAASVDKLVQSLVALDKVTKEIGEDAFVALVKSARDAYNEIVGQSIIPELSARTIAYLDNLREVEQGAFEPLTEAAESAGGGVDVLIGRIHALRQLMGGLVAGVEGRSVFALLDQFVALSTIEPLILQETPTGEVESWAGAYTASLREVTIALATLRGEEVDFLSTQELLFAFLHEIGHAFTDLTSRMAPVEAQLARADFAVVAEEAIRVAAKLRAMPFGEALGETFSSQFAMAFIGGIKDAEPAFVTAFRAMMAGINQALVTYTPELWQNLLAAAPPGIFALEGAPTLVPQLAEETRAALEELRSGQVDVFEPFVEEARRAGVSADMLIERIEALQELVQRDISQDPFFVALSRFVESTTLQIGTAEPLGPFGRYGVETRQIEIYLAQLLEAPTEELFLATYHEYGHALVAAIEQLAPEAAQRFLEAFKRVYVDEAELFDVEEVLAEKFAKYQILGAEDLKRRAVDIFREMKELIVKEVTDLGAILQRTPLIGAPGPAGFLAELGTRALVPTIPVYRGIKGAPTAGRDVGLYWSAFIEEALEYAFLQYEDGILTAVSSIFRTYIDASFEQAFEALAATQRREHFVEPVTGMYAIPPEFRGRVEQLAFEELRGLLQGPAAREWLYATERPALPIPLGAGLGALVPQLEQVRDLVIQTAEVAPGVFVPLTEGAEAAADRTRMLNEEVRKLLDAFEAARIGAIGGPPVLAGAGGVPLLTAGAGGVGGGGLIGTRIGFGDWPEHWFRGQAGDIAQATSAMDRFNIAVNAATIQYFGLRRLGYGLESVGVSMREMSQATIGALEDAAEAYYDFSAAATRAGIAMELQADLFPVLESRILDTSIALGLFAPEEIAEGLRLWTAGTGAVVQSEEDLNKVLSQTTDIQKLAVLNNVDLAETTTNVGAALAEYNLRQEDTRRISEVLNFVAAKTFANVNDVGQAFRFVGPLAREAGDSFESSAAALALAADAGLRGSHAGRALRQIYIQLLDPTEEHNEAMNDALGLSEDLRQSWQDIVFPGGEFIGLAKYIDLLAAATESYTEQQRLELLATISTANELPLLVSLVSQQIEGRKENINVLRAYEKVIRGVTDEETVRYTQFVEQQTGMVFTTQSATSLMREQWETLGQDISFEVWQLEQRHNAAMARIGQAASESLIPLQRIQTEIIEEFSSFVAKYPGVATATAGIGLLTGGLAQLFSIGGKIAGAAANIMIMAFVAKEFGISVGVFGTAVKEFTLGVTGRGAGGVMAGLGALLSRLLAILSGAWVGAAVYPRLTAAAPGVFPETIYTEAGRGLTGFVNLLRDSVLAGAYLWEEARTAEMVRMGTLTEEERAIRMRAVSEMVLDLSYFGDAVQAAAGELSAIRAGPLPFTAYGRVAELGVLEPPITGLTKIQREALDRYQEYLDDREEIQEEYDDRLEDLQKKHLKAQGKAHEDYLRSRQDAIEDYAFREQRIEEDHQIALARIRERYEENVAKIHERYNEALEKANEQHQERIAQYMEDFHKNMERMRLDHIWRMEDLIRERDARGALLEMRSYRRKVREAEEDRDDWLRRQKEDSAKQLKEAEEARDKALKEAKEDFEKQIKEQQEQFKFERERREEDFQRRLDEMKENYERQATERAQQYEDDKQDLIDAKAAELAELALAAGEELTAILGYLDDEEQAYLDSYTQRLIDLEKFLDDYRKMIETYPPIGPPRWADGDGPPRHLPRQYGGYAYGGLYRVGERGREFILDYPTTRALESFVGPLTQERILGAFASRGARGGGGLFIEVSQAYWTFQGSFTEAEKLWFQDAARQAAYAAVDDVAREVLGA